MRAEGYHVMRVWEHDVKKGTWIRGLRAMIRRTEHNGDGNFTRH
jgi:hypothetical protein